jgi:uncharacterized membrane protein
VPVVTFWQVSTDRALGFSTDPGHGHNFTGEHVDGWAVVLQPPGWNDDRAAASRELALSGAFDEPFTPSAVAGG